MALEHPNLDLLVPFDALPPAKAFKPQIFCKNFDHRDQIVQYLVLRPSSDILQTRLACIKCVQGPLSVCSQDLALLEDIAADRFNLLKFTKYQLNEYQQFSDLLHAFDFNFDKSVIELKFNKIQEQLIYELNKCKEKVLNNYENYQQCQQRFEIIKRNLNNTFDFSNVQQKLEEFSALGHNPQPKKWRELNEMLDKFVEKFHQKDSDEQKRLKADLDQLKKNLSTRDQLLLHKHKIEQGVQNIQSAIDEISKVFSNKLFLQSELSDDYIQTVLERIDTKYKTFEEVNKIQRIYSSIYEGLNYQKINLTLQQPKQSQLLFIFKTNADLKFGAYVAPGQNLKNLLFSLTKKEIYPIKGGASAQPALMQPQSQPPNPTSNPQLNQQGKPNSTILPAGPPPGAQPNQNPNFPPNLNQQPLQPRPIQVNPQEQASQQNAPYLNDQKANDNSFLFKFGGQDLIIMSNFSNCTSNLGFGFDISQWNIGNRVMHLANAENFQIVGLEIFTLS